MGKHGTKKSDANKLTKVERERDEKEAREVRTRLRKLVEKATEPIIFKFGFCSDCAQGMLNKVLEGFELYVLDGEPSHVFCRYCGSNNVTVKNEAGDVIFEGGPIYGDLLQRLRQIANSTKSKDEVRASNAVAILEEFKDEPGMKMKVSGTDWFHFINDKGDERAPDEYDGDLEWEFGV